MSHNAIEPVVAHFLRSLMQARSLASAAHQWLDPNFGPRSPLFSPSHTYALIELAFLRSFLAWESFLEESFLLYILGKKPRHRKLARKRYVLPAGHKHAQTFLLPEGGSYAEWDKPDKVLARANKLLRGGEPFESAISPRRNTLLDMHAIRNALVHRSDTSRLSFEKVARNSLGTLPPNITVGSYLDTLLPHSTPPLTQLEAYLVAIEKAADQIAR